MINAGAGKLYLRRPEMTKGQSLIITAVFFVVGGFLIWAAYDSLPRIIKISESAIDFSSPDWGALKRDPKFYGGIVSLGAGLFFLLGRGK